MENKIKEVHNYFREKLINGEFEIKGIIDEHNIGLLIDNKYLFIIWIANEDYGIKTEYRYVNPKWEYSFMDLNFRIKDRKAIWAKIKPIIKKYNDTIILKRKKVQFEKLKRELSL